MPEKEPYLLFAFANDPEPTSSKLDLKEERDAIGRVLDHIGGIQFKTHESATLKNIFDWFKNYNDSIYLFHFSGHSNGSGLQLFDRFCEGDNLATIIGRQKQLKLVFINGCASIGLVKVLHEKGVKAVIATRSKVKDDEAIQLATFFYGLLGAQNITIKDAFERAVGLVKAQSKNLIKINAEIRYRGQGLDSNSHEEFPWGLYVNEEEGAKGSVLNWQMSFLYKIEYYPSGELKPPKHLNNKRPSPSNVDVFIGRKKDLKKIHKKLYKTKFLLLKGQGGIGKTTLAEMYYLKYEEKYEHLAWIFADDNLLEPLFALASQLNIVFQDSSNEREKLKVLLEKMDDWEMLCLLVIDNANNLSELETYYEILCNCRNVHVLVTTRITELKKAPDYPIEPLKENLIYKLFKTHYPPRYNDEEKSLLDDILREVGYNTLVVELLAKTLSELNPYKIGDSLRKIHSDLYTKGLLSLSASANVEIETTHHGVGSLEDIISALYDLKKLSEMENRLLSVFAMLPAEKLELNTIEDLLPEFEHLQSTLKAISKKGWLIDDKFGASFRINPVIQEILCKKNSEEDLLNYCKPLIKSLDDKLAYDEYAGFTDPDITLNEHVVPYHLYALSVLNRIGAMDSQLIINLWERVSISSVILEELTQARDHLEKLDQLIEKHCIRHPENDALKKRFANMYDSLAWSLWKIGKVNKETGRDAAWHYLEAERQWFELADDDPNCRVFTDNLKFIQEELSML